MDVADSIERVSGPVSFYKFRLPESDHTMFLFGDMHFSYDNMCEGCKKSPSCATIVEFIDSKVADAKASGTSLDLFFEFPLIPGTVVNRGAYVDDNERFFMSDGTISTKMSNALRRISGASPAYIGVFHTLYAKYGRQTYRHSSDTGRGDGKKDGESAPVQGNARGVRFHYADARSEDNVRRFLSWRKWKSILHWAHDFQTRIKDTGDMRRLLEVFLCGHRAGALPFQEGLRAVWGSDGVGVEKSWLSSFGGRCMHRTSKQVAKLPPHLRRLVDRYIDDSIDMVCRVLEKSRHNDHVFAYQKFRQALAEYYIDETKSKRLKRRAEKYAYFFAFIMSLCVLIPIMDVYAIARMLKYAHENKGGTSIAYTGAYHTDQYARFFREYLGANVVDCSSVPYYDEDVPRCVVFDSPGGCRLQYNVRSPKLLEVLTPNTKTKRNKRTHGQPNTPNAKQMQHLK